MSIGIILNLALGLLSFSVTAQTSMPSAHRDPNRSYLEYLTRRPLLETQGWRDTAEGMSTQFTEVSLKQKLDAQNFTDLAAEEGLRLFEQVRDLRFLQQRQDPSFLRRISWLYPDDGCFARAELAKRQFQKLGVKELRKVFIFGDLMVDTPNSSAGSVTWWFHVVPVLKIQSEYYAIDPAVDPARPIPILDWIYSMSPNMESVKLAICDSNTYDPGTRCEHVAPLPDDEVLGHQRTYLSYEWFRMKELGRDPFKVLGDSPPWRVHSDGIRNSEYRIPYTEF